MADVVLTINGIGQGHLMRGVNLCRWLRRSGRRPLVIHQGTYPQAIARRYPGVSVPTVYKQTPERREDIRQQILAAVRLSQPALLIEDTHPVELEFPEDVARLLVVRPTVMEHMRMLRQEYLLTYSRFLICDHPASPTWPYTFAETEEILGWGRFECMGPIYRRPTKQGVEDVRRRYGLNPGEPMLVFSLGGGGEKPESRDREQFVDFAERLAGKFREARRETRFLFVCGPLFPESLELPPIFERIPQEPELPSLLACATGAVIRPGYNAMWECIAAGTPFLPRLGTTYMEPSDLRLAAMARAGMRLPGTVEELADSGGREAFAAACREVTQRFSGCPRDRFLQVIEEIAPVCPASVPAVVARGADGVSVQVSARPRSAPAIQTSEPRDGLTFLLEDVACEEEHLAWLFSLFQERGLSLSIAVIPYLTRLGSALLDGIDPERRVSVTMLGYSHLQRQPNREFTEGSGAEVELQRRQLHLGFRLLRFCFRERFRGGFLAPFDAVPQWMPEEWRRMGGTHVFSAKEGSSLARRGTLPLVRLARLQEGESPEQALRCFFEPGCHGFTVSRGHVASSGARRALTYSLDAIAAALAGSRCNLGSKQ